MSDKTVLNGRGFAEAWVAAWNAADLEAVLSHYAPTVRFRSPRAADVTGDPLVMGKAALRAYWREGLQRARLAFRLVDVIVDEPARTLAVLYRVSLNGSVRSACEIMTFDDDGLIAWSEAFYGASAQLDAGAQ